MICNRNVKMRFGPYVIHQGLLAGQPINYLDIGARGGVPQILRQIESGLHVMGCEPDRSECQRINEFYRSQGLHVTLYPYAVHESAGRHLFHIAQFPYSSGLVAANQMFTQRLSEVCHNNLVVVDHVMMETMTIDQLMIKERLPAIEFLKVDTEGSEHNVLKGAMNQLRGRHLLGVESEFWTGPIKVKDNFAAIHELLTQMGFYLFDINIGRYTRRSFPRGFLQLDRKSGVASAVHPADKGQILTGDVVYLRDPVWELFQGIDRFVWTDINVLKMATIYELYELNDCAVELLQTYQGHFASSLDFDRLFNLLTPDIEGARSLGYREYIAASESLPWQERHTFERYWQNPQQKKVMHSSAVT